MRERSEDDPRELRTLINEFIAQRLADKLDKLKSNEQDKRADLLAQHEPGAWLASAAQRVSQLQLATHTVKPIHPDARGSTVFLQASVVNSEVGVGTHSIADRALDVVGNAAALDVFKLLKLSYRGETLIQRLLRGDSCAQAALSDDVELAREWASAFVGIASASRRPASHTLAKQVYFPLPDNQYHLLAPLYPSALIHAWHQILQADRWGDDAKQAREARRKHRSHSHGYVEYPGLAVQGFGGSKPQNISQLNSERGGRAYLLPSLPPNWNSPPVQAPMHCRSIFERAFPGRAAVRELTQTLREFLHQHRAADDNNVEVRRTRSELVERIVDELLAYAAELHALQPGWSARPECRLVDSQIAWLDPYSMEVDSLDDLDEPMSWSSTVARAFGNWLNSALQSKQVVLDDLTAKEWRLALQPHLEDFDAEQVDERAERQSQEVGHAA